MSIDRRIVSILHYNGINDVNKVEKFIGTNGENYYEILIDGKIEKLKIPGVEYFEIPTVKDLESKIEQVNKNIEKLESFTNNLEEVIESIKDSTKDQLFTTTIIEEQKISFEEELEKTEKENEKILESLKETKPKTPKKPKPRTPKLSEKKIEIIESKNTDDDINDFLTTI